MIRKINKEGLIKLFLSFSLLVYSIIVSVIAKNFIIAAAMLCSSIGDFCIMASRGVFSGKKRKDSFSAGVIMFAIAHCIYISAMENKYTDIFFIVAVLVMIVTSSAAQNIDKGAKAETVMMVSYAVCLLINMINAFIFSILSGVGVIFFMISDGILALKEKKEPKWQIPIWITYVLAQICIITSFLIK